MGNGIQIAEHTGNARMEKLAKQYNGILPLSLKNIVLLTADGLDALVSICERGESTVVEFMREMKKRALTDDRSKVIFTAEQLLKLGQNVPAPSYLKKAESQWMESTQSRYGGKRRW